MKKYEDMQYQQEKRKPYTGIHNHQTLYLKAWLSDAIRSSSFRVCLFQYTTLVFREVMESRENDQCPAQN
jgi:hypothetical protein